MNVPSQFRQRSKEEKRNGVVITGEPLKLKPRQKKRHNKKRVAKNEQCLDYSNTRIAKIGKIRSKRGEK